MPGYKTLIENATTLNILYPADNNDPKKTAVQTDGDLYHARLNVAHGQAYKKISQSDASNFALATLVFIIQTPKKRVPISFPVLIPRPVYNYKALTNPEDFKEFCQSTQNESVAFLAHQNLKLTSHGGYMDYDNAADRYYPQIAFHTEKFFFHYLNTEYLEKIINLFPQKSITAKNLISIDAVEIRMHSTRDMCPTCESITIAGKQAMQEKLNSLLVTKGYPALPQDFTCDFIMSYNNTKERKDKLNQNFVGVKSQRISAPHYTITDKKTLLFTNLFGYFSSGGSSDASKALTDRNTHLNAVLNAKLLANKATTEITTEAATNIQRIFREHLVRKTMKNKAN